MVKSVNHSFSHEMLVVKRFGIRKFVFACSGLLMSLTAIEPKFEPATEELIERVSLALMCAYASDQSMPQSSMLFDRAIE